MLARLISAWERVRDSLWALPLAVAALCGALALFALNAELPPNTEAQVRPRSGLALKHGISVLNTPGTIDHGYRGEVGVILINHGRSRFDVRPGMKVAQLVIAPFVSVSVEETGELSSTARGPGGFGSTGV